MSDRALSAAFAALTTFACGLAATASAVAQSTPPAASAGGSSTAAGPLLEEIVVTARKVEERLQDVPLTVTAFSADDLARRSVQQLEDVARYTPGFAFEDFATGFNAAPSLRGLSQVNVQGAVQNVATFLDGVYLQRGYSIDVGAIDLVRLEIVKGPQNALYGQSAFAGAINYVLAKPGEELEMSTRLTFGTANRRDISAAIGGQLPGGKFGMRAAYARNSFDGTWDNSYPGSSGDLSDLGGSETENWSVTAVLKPVERVSLEATFLRTERKQEIQGNYSVAANDPQNRLDCGPFVTATFVNAAGQSVVNPMNSPRFICGEIPLDPSKYQTALSTRPAGIIEPVTPGVVSEINFTRAQLHVDFTDSVALNYIFGRVDAEAGDSSTTGVNKFSPTTLAAPFGRTIQAQRQGGTNSLKSHEVRIDWEPESLPVTARVGYYHAEVADRFLFGSRRLAPGLPFEDAYSDPTSAVGLTTVLNNFQQLDETDAYFAQFSWRGLDDRLRLTAEARRQSDDRTLLTLTTVPTTRQSGTFESTTPRFTADFKLRPDNLLYASAAKGVKAGGFNPTTVGQGAGLPPLALLPSEQLFEDEVNWTYEVGSKNKFLDGRLLLNASVFLIEWQKMQIRSVPTNFVPQPANQLQAPPVIFLNLGNATSKGVELQGVFAVNRNLTLNLSATWQDPTYDSGTKSRRFAGVPNCDNVLCPQDGEVGGNQLDRVYTFAAATGASFEAPLTDSLAWFLRGDVTYQDKQYAEEMNLAWLPGRTLVNASVGLSGDSWDLTLWGKNVLDKKYVSNSLFIIQFGSYTPGFGERATAGVTFNWRL